MTLRARLSLIISFLFLAGMLLGLSFLIVSARERVVDEVASSATLTYQLLDTLLPIQARGSIPPDSQAFLQQISSIEDARHLDITISSSDAPPAAVVPQPVAAPHWFVSLVRTDPVIFSLPLNNSGDMINISTNPADEIEEVWQDTRTFMILLLLVLILLNGMLYLILGRWLSPVKTILHNLEEVEGARNMLPVSGNALPELKVIADKIEGLSGGLQRSREENELLLRRSLKIQEEERRNLARELHDEMGQSISAVKAIAFSIAERNTEDAMSREGAERIGTISNHIRDHVRSMMHRLRPVVLDELGLVAALEYMADDWNHNHASIFCSLRISGNLAALDEHSRIHLYRIVQESLTNVAAHAGATTVDIQLQADAGHVRLHIVDDGRGFDPATVSRGMGLKGMQERATALGADWQLQTSPGAGVRIALSFPLPDHDPGLPSE